MFIKNTLRQSLKALNFGSLYMANYSHTSLIKTLIVLRIRIVLESYPIFYYDKSRNFVFLKLIMLFLQFTLVYAFIS